MISCSVHDHVELVCMHKFPIKISLVSGEVIECIALDTVVNENREECIKVRSDGADVLVVLDAISELRVTIDNPHFSVVTFS